MASQSIVTCIRNRRLGCTEVVLDGTHRPKDAGLGIIIKLEIGILNEFCSRLTFQYLSFSLVTFQGKFRNLKRENLCNLTLHIRRRVSKISGWPKRF